MSLLTKDSKGAKPIAFYGKKDKTIVYITENDKGSASIQGDNCFIYPNPTNRECIYVAGQSGSGKTSFANRYAKNFRRLFPERGIFLFTAINPDIDPNDGFDDEGIQRINMLEFFEKNLQVDEFPDYCLIIFDDCDTFRNKEMLRKVSDLQYKILEVGRHKNIYTIILSHLLIRDNRADNARMYNESHLLTIFPNYGNKQHIRRILSHYFNVELPVVDILLKNNKSRWMTFCRQYPKYVVCDDGVLSLE